MLQTYMREVNKIPLLDRKSERELALKVYEKNDREAFQRLVAANLRFVVKIAYDYIHYRIQLLDLIQEGNIGLAKAVQQFDPYKNVRLTTYAVWWIRSYIQDYILRNFSLVKLGTTQTQKKLFYRLRRAQEELARKGIEGPTSVKLLASSLDAKEKEIEQMQVRLGQRDLSLNAPVTHDSKGEHLDRIQSSEPSFAEQLSDSEQKTRFKSLLEEFAKTLEGRELEIYQKRLISESPLTLQEIGDLYGVSKERARQLEEQIKEKIRHYIHERYPEYELE